MMRNLFAGLLAASLSSAALAAPPPIQPGYQINLGIGYSSPGYAYGQVPMWIDTTSALSAAVPYVTRPTSAEYPLPVASKLAAVTYSAPDAHAIAVANTAVTIFAAGSVPTSCDISNPNGNDTLYLDPTGATAVAGSGTAFPVLPGQTYHCQYPPTGAVSAIADKAQSFVAVRY